MELSIVTTERTGIALTVMIALQADSRTFSMRLRARLAQPAKLLQWELTYANPALLGITRCTLVRATVTRVDIVHQARASAAPASQRLTLDVPLVCRARRMQVVGIRGPAVTVIRVHLEDMFPLLGRCPWGFEI